MSDFDGKTLRLLRFANALEENGYRIDFLTTECRSAEIRRRFSVFEIPVALESIFRDNYRPILSEIQNTTGMARRLSGKILKLISNYSIVLSSYSSSGLLTTACVATTSFLNGIPHFFDYDDLGPEMSCAIKGWSMTHPFSKAHLLLEGLICQCSDVIIAMSEMMRERLTRTGSIRKIVVIHNVPSANEFELVRPINQTREIMGLPRNSFVFAYLGNIQQRIRGLEMIVEAVDVLKNGDNDYLVLVIGTGTGEERLKTEIRQRKLSEYFLLTGEISKEKALSYLNAANVSLVLLPHIEADYMAPTKLFISMALGKHLIVTDSKQIRLLIGSAPIVLSKQPTPREVAKSMLEAMRDFRTTEVNKHYRRLFLNSYCWEKEKQAFIGTVSNLC